MLADTITIGELHISTSHSNEVHSIKVWPGYGVVCRELGTLNGCIEAIAGELAASRNEIELMRSELRGPSYTETIFLEGKKIECLDKVAVARQLSAIYERVTGTSV